QRRERLPTAVGMAEGCPRTVVHIGDDAQLAVELGATGKKDIARIVLGETLDAAEVVPPRRSKPTWRRMADCVKETTVVCDQADVKLAVDRRRRHAHRLRRHIHGNVFELPRASATDHVPEAAGRSSSADV